MGTRLRPWTDRKPKCMVPVLGEPIIERQIRFLHAAGVSEIVVVTGHLHGELAFLESRYGVKLIRNDRYEVYNNIYSLYLAREYLRDSFILDGDVYLVENAFLRDVSGSCYFSAPKEGFVQEWILHLDEANRVTKICVTDGSGYIISGISFWTGREARTLRELLEWRVAQPGFDDLFWDHLVKDYLGRFEITVEKIGSNDCFEIDTLEDLWRVEHYLKHVHPTTARAGDAETVGRPRMQATGLTRTDTRKGVRGS